MLEERLIFVKDVFFNFYYYSSRGLGNFKHTLMCFYVDAFYDYITYYGF